MSPHTPLWKVRQYVHEHRDAGCVCPGCDQRAQVYRRKIHAGIAHDLVTAYCRVGLDPFHVSLLGKSGSELSKLTYWGLLVELPGDRDDGSTHGGMWQITEAGRAFVRRQLRVPKYARVYDAHLLGLEPDETADIIDALADKFRYDDLMRGL